jgi:hypothetical protein
MLMGAYDSRIDHRVFIIRIRCQVLEHLLPDSAFGPTAKAGMHHAKVAKTLGKITPWNTGSVTVQNSLYKQPVIFGRTTYRPASSRKQTFDALPLIVTQSIPLHTHLAKLFTDSPTAYS